MQSECLLRGRDGVGDASNADRFRSGAAPHPYPPRRFAGGGGRSALNEICELADDWCLLLASTRRRLHPPLPATQSRRGGYGWGALMTGESLIRGRDAVGDAANADRFRSGAAPHPYPPHRFAGGGERSALNEHVSWRATGAYRRYQWADVSISLPPRRSRGGEGTGGGALMQSESLLRGWDAVGHAANADRLRSGAAPHPYPPRRFAGGGRRSALGARIELKIPNDNAIRRS